MCSEGEKNQTLGRLSSRKSQNTFRLLSPRFTPRTARIPKTRNARGHLYADILIPQRRVPRDECVRQADALLVLHHLNRNAALPQQLFFSHERPVLAHDHAQWGEHLVSAWLGKNPRDLSTPPQSPAWRGPSWSVDDSCDGCTSN